MAVVPVIPVVPVVPSDCVDDGMAVRMCEDNTSHPVEMPKQQLFPPDYKVVCLCRKRGCVNF